MTKLLIFVGTVGFGFLFGWIADLLGADFLVSFLCSGVGSMVGVIAGWKLSRHLP